MAARMKILAVCGMGFGSSMILKMTMEHVLKDLGIKADIVIADIGTAKSESADLIVTSHEFGNLLRGRNIPMVEMKNYVDREEMKAKLMPLLKPSLSTTTKE
jgi:ascorbate PTS system EIIB component